MSEKIRIQYAAPNATTPDLFFEGDLSADKKYLQSYLHYRGLLESRGCHQISADRLSDGKVLDSQHISADYQTFRVTIHENPLGLVYVMHFEHGTLMELDYRFMNEPELWPTVKSVLNQIDYEIADGDSILCNGSVTQLTGYYLEGQPRNWNDLELPWCLDSRLTNGIVIEITVSSPDDRRKGAYLRRMAGTWNAEGMQSLQELSWSSQPEDRNETILNAIAGIGIVNLDKSVASFHEAQRKAKGVETEIQTLEAKIEALNEEKKRLQSQVLVLEKQENDLVAVTPLDVTDTLKVLFSFVYEIRQAINCARSYLEERTGIYFYHLPFLERFVLSALEGHLMMEWSSDEMWATTVDAQITQRISPYWRSKKESSWANVFADLKKNLSSERLQVLVSGVCESEQCDANQLKGLIAQLREKAKERPAEYQVQ